MTAVVRAVAVSRKYGAGTAAVTALDNVSVAVEHGCFTAVVGPSGSGKSTLLHCLAGLDRVDSGTVYIGEMELTRLSERKLTRLRRDRPTTNFGAYLMTPADLSQLGTGAATVAYVRAAAAPAAAGAAVARVAADYPALEVHDRASLHEPDLRQIDGAIAVYRTLTGLAALLGLFGIVGTLALSIVERRRELGLLRAVGMQRRQVRSMIRAEAVIVALVGTVLGLGLGALFGWATAKVFEHSSQPTEFTVPAGTLAAVAVLAALAGTAAAVLPARLASRVDLLRAIAAE